MARGATAEAAPGRYTASSPRRMHIQWQGVRHDEEAQMQTRPEAIAISRRRNQMQSPRAPQMSPRQSGALSADCMISALGYVQGGEGGEKDGGEAG